MSKGLIWAVLAASIITLAFIYILHNPDYSAEPQRQFARSASVPEPSSPHHTENEQAPKPSSKPLNAKPHPQTENRLQDRAFMDSNGRHVKPLVSAPHSFDRKVRPSATESRFVIRSVDKNGVDAMFVDAMSAAETLADYDDFRTTMDSLKAEELASETAKDLTQAYLQIFDEFVRSNDFRRSDFELQDMTCGNSLCIGHAYANDTDAVWEQFLDFFIQMGGQSFKFTQHGEPIDEMTIDQRFLFTTNPDIVGFSSNGPVKP